ncbi:MAG: hypothetical protein Q8N81_03960, partial [bacterium]|nr:hypothetical protein [bacterium]
LFALDIFGQGYNFWQTIVGLFMHLIPSFVLILVLLVAWKKEILGGWLYIGLGFIFIAIARGNIIYSLPILLPIILIGILFLATGRRKN